MRKMIILYSILSLAVAFTGCGGGDDDELTPAAITITASQDAISVPAEGGTYTIDITTTGKEWGAYTEEDFISVETQNTLTSSGSVSVKVSANPNVNARSGAVVLMSGTARKSIAVNQAAARNPPTMRPKDIRSYGAMSSTMAWN
jgi:hypothetical protein